MSDRRLRATHELGAQVTVSFGEMPLARYVYLPDPAPFEGPKPYLHPLRTLAGDVVTGYRPHDHRWHKGLQLTATDVSGHNLWGGNTFVAGSGYQRLDNVGSMRCEGVVEVGLGAGDVTVEHELTWLTAAEGVLCAERRRLVIGAVDEAARVWRLRWVSEIRNVSAQPLEFGSPATRGLPGSGYAGLSWRGPRAFTGGQVAGPGGVVDADAMRGEPAPWLAYVGQHDDVDHASTLIFADDTSTPGRWFVRTAEFALVNPSWAFHRPFTLEPGESTRREYRMAVADGAWEPDRIVSWVEQDSW